MRSAADGIALWWLLVVTSVDAFRRKKTTCFSLRSQQLLLVAYLARYVDVCWNFTSLNMTMIKVHSIVAASPGTVLLRVLRGREGLSGGCRWPHPGGLPGGLPVASHRLFDPSPEFA